MQCVFTVLQDIVRIAADNDTRAFLSQLQDHVALDVPQKIGGGQSVHHTGNTLRGKGVGEQTFTGRMFAMFFHKLRRKAGFHCDLIHKLLIIEGNTKFLGHLTSYGAATGTKLTADGNDFLFHAIASFRNNTLSLLDYYSNSASKCQSKRMELGKFDDLM